MTIQSPKPITTIEKDLAPTVSNPVCITGMHRSGTSMITRLLNLCGLYLGPEELLLPAQPDNPEGFWEIEEIHLINNDILERFGGAWDQPPASLPDRYSDIPEMMLYRQRAQKILQIFDKQAPWGWKDPRSSLTLNFWREILGDLKVIICLRNPLDAVGSLTSRGTPVHFGYQVWQSYYKSLLDQAKDLPFLITHYDSYFYNGEAELQRLIDFLGLATSKTQVREAVYFTKTQLRKHSSTDQDLANSVVPLEIVQNYLELCEQAGPVYRELQESRPLAALSLSPAEQTKLLHSRLSYLNKKLETTQVELETSRHDLYHTQLHRDTLLDAHETLQITNQNLQAANESLKTQQLEQSVRLEPNGVTEQELRITRLKLGNLENTVQAQAVEIQRLNGQISALHQDFSNQLNRASTLENELEIIKGTPLFRTSRLPNLFKEQLRQNIDVASNLLARPLVQAVKGAVECNLDQPWDECEINRELDVKGWAFSRAAAISQVEVILDGVLLAKCSPNQPRPDVLAIHPWIVNAKCGFAETFLLPDGLYHGAKELLIRITDAKGNKREISRTVKIKKPTATEQSGTYTSVDYSTWIAENEPDEIALFAQRKEASNLDYRPLFSIITPVYNPSPTVLRTTIQSVLTQTYENFELCLIDGASSNPRIKQILQEYAISDSRVRVKFLEENLGISENSNQALQMAEGDYVILLDHDDELAPFALYETAMLLNQFPDADMIYSDEDKIDEHGNRSLPFFKPDWAPAFFRSLMYTCHLGVYRRKLVKEIGGFRIGLEGAQDYDLILRLIERTGQIYHIPKVLYHWRMSANSTALSGKAKTYARKAQIQALTEHCARLGLNAVVEPGLTENTLRMRYILPEHPRVSIIIPTKDQLEILKICINSIRERSTYTNYELVIVNNGSVEPETLEYFAALKKLADIQVLDYPKEFNFSAINNFAVKHVESDLLLFLNNDTEVIAEGWIEALVEHAMQPEVGVVGARLLYPDLTLQHAGVIMGLGGVAGHSHKFYPAEHPGYAERAQAIQNFSAVTAACMMTRREVFDLAHGFDENNLAIAFNDVDFCLKVFEKGFQIVWTPYAELFHHESISRGPENSPRKLARFQREIRFVQQRWSDILPYDPYYNPNLTQDYEDFSIGRYARLGTKPYRKPPILVQGGLAANRTAFLEKEGNEVPEVLPGSLSTVGTSNNGHAHYPFDENKKEASDF